MNPHVIDQNGEAYLSMTAITRILEMSLVARDNLVEQNPAAEFLVPGSDATVDFLTRILGKIRHQYFETADLDEEIGSMIEGLDDLLDNG